MTPESARNLALIIAEWSKSNPLIRAVAVVGSWARKEAQADSDLDMLLLATEPKSFYPDTHWLEDIEFASGRYLIKEKTLIQYGIVWSHHLFFESGEELELAIAPLDWAKTDPIDEGTANVINNGCEILVDKDDLLKNLVNAQ